ncbi:MAG: T9SS type A sorting domain-containing protein [Bacteroidia bacterium]|nr:T9SS type A sorting domain-containing protein [Bacteroidia bacterium]
MKKLLLLSIAIGIMVGTYAQNKFAVRKNVVFQNKEISKNVVGMDVPYTPLLLKPNGAKKKSVNPVKIGTSVNLFGFVITKTNCLDYDPATNTVMFTHRAGGAWGGSGADIRCKFSTDWFAVDGIGQFTANTDSVVFVNDGTHLRRYPNGVIYNPAGNTDFHNAFAVICGPVTGSTSWTDTYFHSERLDKTLLSNFYHPLVAPETGLETINLSGGNGNLHILSQDDDGTNYLPYVKVRNGIFNSTTNAFDWSLTPTQITRLWGSRIFSGGAVDANFAWNQAWASDGLIGYAFCVGIDSTMKYFQGAQLPQIARTTDGGLTYQTITPFACWDHLTNLTDSIWPTMASVTGAGTLEYRPFFNAGSTLDDNTLPGVVDANGNLHMAAIIEGYYSNYVGVEDSTGYSYASHPKFLFDAIYDWQTQLWDVRFIDQIYSTVVEDASGAAFTTSPPPNVGYEHFINVSRSADGNVIFYTWTDTDPSYGAENISPYIKSRAWNIQTNMATLSKNFVDPLDGGLYFYVNTADVVKKQGSTYSIAMTYIDVAGDAGSNADAAQIEYFITDATFDESEFTEIYLPSNMGVLCQCCWTCCTGINNNESNKFSVSQNYPNPANGATSIKVTLTETSNVTVEITNLVGQLVSKIDKGILAAGNHSINLNTASLNSGIYFYTVTAGTEKITKKMIVE